jgi:intraflagellar transport protein 172
VVVDEGINTIYLSLNESLIAFSSALEDHDYAGAAAILEGLGGAAASSGAITGGGESEGMWTQLGQAALDAGQLRIAERCYAALGDVARARYLRKTHRIAEMAGNGNAQEGMSHYIVRAKLAVLGKQFKQAEMTYLEQGQVQDAMDMYQELHKWDESIAVAEARGHPEVQTLRRNYLQWLIQV